MPPRCAPSAYRSSGCRRRRLPGIMNVRGTQHGSRRRMPAPASIASCAPVREDVLVAMGPIRYRGRRAATIENDELRVTVLEEGGHIAEILDKAAGVNPLWTPPWPSIEPSTWDAALHPEYGNDAESK